MIPFVKDDFEEECKDFYSEMEKNTFAALAFLDIAAHVRVYNLHTGKPLKILRASANTNEALFDDAPESRNDRCILLHKVMHGQVLSIQGNLKIFSRKKLQSITDSLQEAYSEMIQSVFKTVRKEPLDLEVDFINRWGGGKYSDQESAEFREEMLNRLEDGRETMRQYIYKLLQVTMKLLRK